MHLRALVFLILLAVLVVLPGGQQLFGAEPLPPARAANPGGFERREQPGPAPALPSGGTRPAATAAAPARPEARPAAASDGPAGVSYQYDALGRIREIVRVPGR
jgi:hypothetical protein